MSPWPERYPSTIDLPFNHACLSGRFIPEPQDREVDGAGYWFLIAAGAVLMTAGAGDRSLPQGDKLQEGIVIAAPPLHFGTWDSLPCRVAPLSRALPLPPGWVWESFSSPSPTLGIDLVSLAALAQQILHWEKRSALCPACGGSLQRIVGGWGKSCQECQAPRFPAIHPCVIVLIYRPGELLLARKAEWPAGRYGLVAGFLDFGESLEEAVIREVREETGVEVDAITYCGSQSWPFPSQVMAGFTAQYAGGELCVDHLELEDARWFSLHALPELPPLRSIARYLLDQHLSRHG